MIPIVLEDFEIEIDRAEALRLLGNSKGAYSGRDGTGAKKGRVEKTIEDAFREAKDLIRPKGIYLFAAGDDLPGSGQFAGLERMAFCICTIGPDLEERVTGLSEEGNLLDAVVLDAIGSAAAEAVARFLDDIIAKAAAAEGLKTSCRASPGYGDWHVREQKNLFELLDGGVIGVKLSESSMMIPRKSVSFAKHIDKIPKRLRSENSCRNCDMDTCPYRICD